MNYLSKSMTAVRGWFPEAATKSAKETRPLEMVEFDATVGIARAGDDRIDASIAGRISARESDADRRYAEDDPSHLGLGTGPDGAETRVEARRRSLGALADAEPFVWLQLFDDRGASLTHETFLGHGVGVEYRVRAQFPRAAGLHARVVTRTYRNRSGPRYHAEVLILSLLAVKTAPARGVMAPAIALAP